MVRFFIVILSMISGFTLFFFNNANAFVRKVAEVKILPHRELVHHSITLLSKSLFFGLVVLGGGIAIGLGVIGVGVGRGGTVRGALNGMGRNPGMEKRVVIWMITGVAIAEALALYALLITFILFYANPFKGIF